MESCVSPNRFSGATCGDSGNTTFGGSRRDSSCLVKPSNANAVPARACPHTLREACLDRRWRSIIAHALQPKAIALVAAGHAELHQENHGKAVEHFAEVLDRKLTPNFFLHWHWRIQAHIGLTAALLRSGDMPRARLEAARCLESAQSTADPSLRALALEINARVAFADHNLLGSWQHIQRALTILEEFDVPVALWRVHAAAWELCPNKEEAERHRVIATGTILNIANSFDSDEPLRSSLLSAAPVRNLLGSLSGLKHERGA